MIVRSSFRIAAARSSLSWRQRVCSPRIRKLSTVSTQPSTPPSTLSMLGGVTNELDKIAPRFEIEASQIEILDTPVLFYETLKAKILKAKRRIFLSTLYIGKTEHELISTIRQALEQNPELKVSFLTDALRGTRETPNPSCASLLVPLVKDFGSERVTVHMYHTPNLTGLRKKVIPKRINEGWGLQHMKLYGIDDEIIISGANLSDDYFTNRLDRYHIFSDAALTTHYHRIHTAICALSFLALPSTPTTPTSPTYTLTWPSSNPAPSPLTNPSAYKTAATTHLTSLSLLHPQKPTTSTPLQPPKKDTQVYPLLQLTPLLSPDTSTEKPTLLTLLSLLSTPSTPLPTSSWTFTAGYFNPHPSITAALLSPSTSPTTTGTVITASPWANGFYNSAGISGMLPPAYSLLSRRFLERAARNGLADRIKLKEWRRGTVGEEGGWTYHAKGLWITLQGQPGPSVSLVGSSNYTKRSYSLDLEVDALVVTRNEGLMRRLGDEVRWLQDDAREVGVREFVRTERRVGVRVRVAMWVVTLLGGAL